LAFRSRTFDFASSGEESTGVVSLGIWVILSLLASSGELKFWACLEHVGLLSKEAEKDWVAEKVAYNGLFIIDDRQVDNQGLILVFGLHTEECPIVLEKQLEYVLSVVDDGQMHGAKTLFVAVADFRPLVNLPKWVQHALDYFFLAHSHGL